MKRISLSILALAVLSGCNGGSSETSSPVSGKKESLSGKVADGYLQGATVCLDINNNMLCDAEEPQGHSDENGQYSIEIENLDQANRHPIIAIVDRSVIDDDTKETVVNPYTLVAPPGRHAFVSPMTTLLAANAKDYSQESIEAAEVLLREKMGLDEDVDLFADFVEKGRAGDEDYQAVHATAQLVARKLGVTLANLDDNADAKSQLAVAADDAVSNLEELKQIAQVYDDPDVVLALKEKEWQAEAQGIDLQDRQDTIDAEKQYPALKSAGVVKVINLEGDVSYEAEVAFATDQTDFLADYEVTLLDESNDVIYTFVEKDFGIDDGQVKLVADLSNSDIVLTEQVYRIQINKEGGKPFVLASQAYQDLGGTLYDQDVVTDGTLYWGTDEGEVFFSFPVFRSDRYYSLDLLNTDGDVVYYKSPRLGRNKLWLPEEIDPASVARVSIYESDGDDIESVNYIQHIYDFGFEKANTSLQGTFERTMHNVIVKQEAEKQTVHSSFVLQFNVQNVTKPVVGDQPLEPVLQTVKIEAWNEKTGAYDMGITKDAIMWNDKEGLSKVGDYYELEDESLSKWYQLLTGQDAPYLDGYFRDDTVELTDVPTLFRYQFYDTQGGTFTSYSYFDHNKSAPTTARDVNITQPKPTLIQVDVTKDGDNQADFYYEFTVVAKVKTEGKDRSKSHRVLSVKTGTEHVGLLTIEQINQEIAVMKGELAANQAITGVYVQPLVWDSAKSEATNYRMKYPLLSIDAYLK
ncbi:hypothetical protein [Thaumasiovibrio subtropicus]|uniref:hypothetical protein n=1 Tax=Thaumasiovibrio subtropicus TaxID=1891207 RepID=UPI000B34BA08|nr:hypothetical protein [Thaumasiovibrio subtropicus]